ncbi:unnamed protein product, partial [Closterium sp. NIES-53]
KHGVFRCGANGAWGKAFGNGGRDEGVGMDGNGVGGERCCNSRITLSPASCPLRLSSPPSLPPMTPSLPHMTPSLPHSHTPSHLHSLIPSHPHSLVPSLPHSLTSSLLHIHSTPPMLPAHSSLPSLCHAPLSLPVAHHSWPFARHPPPPPVSSHHLSSPPPTFPLPHPPVHSSPPTPPLPHPPLLCAPLLDFGRTIHDGSRRSTPLRSTTRFSISTPPTVPNSLSLARPPPAPLNDAFFDSDGADPTLPPIALLLLLLLMPSRLGARCGIAQDGNAMLAEAAAAAESGDGDGAKLSMSIVAMTVSPGR